MFAGTQSTMVKQQVATTNIAAPGRNQAAVSQTYAVPVKHTSPVHSQKNPQTHSAAAPAKRETHLPNHKIGSDYAIAGNTGKKDTPAASATDYAVSASAGEKNKDKDLDYAMRSAKEQQKNDAEDSDNEYATALPDEGSATITAAGDDYATLPSVAQEEEKAENDHEDEEYSTPGLSDVGPSKLSAEDLQGTQDPVPTLSAQAQKIFDALVQNIQTPFDIQKGEREFNLLFKNAEKLAEKAALGKATVGVTGDTLLHLAVRKGREFIVRTLMSKKLANIFQQNKAGETPLELAINMVMINDVKNGISYFEDLGAIVTLKTLLGAAHDIYATKKSPKMMLHSTALQKFKLPSYYLELIMRKIVKMEHFLDVNARSMTKDALNSVQSLISEYKQFVKQYFRESRAFSEEAKLHANKILEDAHIPLDE